MSGNLLLIYICTFHVLNHFLLIYTCKLHWNLKDLPTMVSCHPRLYAVTNYRIIRIYILYSHHLTRNCHNLTRTCYNLTRNCHDVTRKCYNLTRNCHHLTRNFHNLTRTCYNLTRNCHNLTRACLKLTRTCHHLTRNCHNLTRNCNPKKKINPELPGTVTTHPRLFHRLILSMESLTLPLVIFF
jgi:hypothetical protein